MTANDWQTDIAIIGAGFGGIGLGIRLKRAGFCNFKILERSSDLGGVWRDNTYPGAACDVPSRLYSYSFEQDWPWQSHFGSQVEILAYLRHCASKHGLMPHIELNREVEAAKFDGGLRRWRIRLADDGEIFARILVSGIGIFNQPVYPDIPGRERFAGPSFHSSDWDHRIDLVGKRVAAIGTGASAIQFVPEVAKSALELYVFHRSPQYVRARDRAQPVISNAATSDRRAAARRAIERLRIFRGYDDGIERRYSHQKAAAARETWLGYLAEQVPDPELRRKLTPQYPFGCKRMLQSDAWYPALQRANVELIDTPAVEIMQDAIRTRDGKARAVDVIIYGTGFRPTQFLPNIRIVGRDGFDLAAAWTHGAEAYLGLTVAGCPNFYMLYGPNTNSSGSIIFFLEQQARYIVRCLKAMRRRGADMMEVRREAQDAFNTEVRLRLANSVVASPDCLSYFKMANGRIVTQWPWTMREYRKRTRRVDLSAYVLDDGAEITSRGRPTLQA
ncbi:MAG: flavin-containing monooxygenase [Hyphomicrobiaceae bacterium]